MKELRREPQRACLSKKYRLQLMCAIFLILIGSGLLIAGFIVPPMGVIDSSILVAFGEILTFVGTLFGIDYHYKSKTDNINKHEEN